MNNTGIFVLGLIGSVLGILGSFVWMVIGTVFFGGMIDHDMPASAPLTDDAFAGGVLIAVIHSVITIALFIVTLIKSTPASLAKGRKNSGIWLLVLGILTCVINLFHLIPGILIIIAGALGLQGENKMEQTGRMGQSIDLE